MKLKLDLLFARTLIISFSNFDLAVEIPGHIKKIIDMSYKDGCLNLVTPKGIEIIDLSDLANNLFIHDADAYKGPPSITKEKLKELIRDVEGIEWCKEDFTLYTKTWDESYMGIDGLLFNFYKFKSADNTTLRVSLMTNPRRYADFYLHGNGHFAVTSSNFSAKNEWKAKFYVERNANLLKSAMRKTKWVKQI